MEEELLIAIRLSKAGYGRVDTILDMPVNIVMAIVDYEKFNVEYEACFIELNREPRK